jgi:type IV pilus assembly protein PilY1
MALAGGVLAALHLGASTASAQATDAELACAKDLGLGGALSTNASRLAVEARLFQASFDTRDWSGRLRAMAVDRNGALGAAVWEATIPAAAQRRIFTSSAAGAAIEFTWQALVAAGMQAAIGDGDLLNYLRGDQSREASPGQPAGFRKRGVRLGAIVNSQIALSGGEDFGYEALVDTADLASPASAAGLAYAAYLRAKAGRTRLALVGANDGMLHAFDAASGAEKFAYLPRTLLAEPVSATDPRSVLVRLADPASAPRFYVDGSPFVGDAYWGGAWHTVAVGTTGVGGRGVFALDITDPEAMSAGKVLWDIDGRTDANLGYPVGQAVIGRLHDGNFYAVFGNGYRSANGCPVLYLVRLPDGQLRRVPTGGRSLGDACAAPNGLGRPSLHDVHERGSAGHRTTDYVYAGDLRGNLWRFDLRQVNLQNDPPTGVGVERVLVATDAAGLPQPITGPIEIGAAPAAVAQAGTGPRPAALWFGTGRHLAADDRGDPSRQSVYGIVDRFDGPLAGGDLQRQTISVASGLAGVVGGASVDYTGAAAGRRQHGWVIDLPRPGERLIGWPLVRQGRLLFASLLPDGDKCFAGTSSIFAVDPFDGVGLARRIFAGDPAADFIGSTAGIVQDLAYVDVGARAYLFAAGGALQLERIEPAPGGTRGRASWREVFR